MPFCAVSVTWCNFRSPMPRNEAKSRPRFSTGLLGAEEVRRLSPDLRAVASGVEVTGAQIKNAALGALFSSRRESAPVSAPTCCGR